MLADNVKALMKEKNISVGEMCRKTGISESTLQRIRNGTTLDPGLDTLSPIAKVLGVSLDELRGTEGIKTVPAPIEPPKLDERRVPYELFVEVRDSRDAWREAAQRKNKIISFLTVTTSVLVTAVIALFIYDFMHGDRGYILYSAAASIYDRILLMIGL